MRDFKPFFPGFTKHVDMYRFTGLWDVAADERDVDFGRRAARCSTEPSIRQEEPDDSSPDFPRAQDKDGVCLLERFGRVCIVHECLRRDAPALVLDEMFDEF